MLLRYIFFFSLLLLTTLGISPSAGFSGFMPTAPNIGYGSAGKTIASSAAKGVAELGKSAKKVAKGVAKGAADAAKRLGINLDNVPITNGVARTKIEFSSTLNSKDINKLKEVFKARGATKAEIDTGFIANEKLNSFLRLRVQDGKSFNGGTVRFSNSKNSDFTIDFDL